MNLIIDEGNTRIKLAVFENGQLIHLVVSNVVDFEKKMAEVLLNHKIKAVILSSVTDKVCEIIHQLELENKVFLSENTMLPFTNLYETPKTLGADRLALVANAWSRFRNKNCLIIDAGTCVTYDFITKNGEYLGGAISPGLEMRFKGLHTFTEKLPLLEIPPIPVNNLGKTTQQSIQSGVLNGLVFEIEGHIENYLQQYEEVTIILTGGDADSLYKQLKNSIFVFPNFLLEGLDAILTYQNKNEAKNK
ncbi:MAG: type III pantothenate kinase [Wenyingzhuangia sp.]|uniref:type III pantothenate kinase n=1 Tax=Wenyingzhuangia sp. TaxID=1964193 RepID=UPI00321981DB